MHGAKTTVYTDHEPLVGIQDALALMPRHTRWVELLQEFDLKIVYKPGKSNVAADVLSRPPVEAADVFDVHSAETRQLVSSWLQRNAPKLDYDSCIEAGELALRAGRTLAAVRCPCGALHLDEGKRAQRKHVAHVCVECGATFRIHPAV